jgi:hypothetical protein
MNKNFNVWKYEYGKLVKSFLRIENLPLQVVENLGSNIIASELIPDEENSIIKLMHDQIKALKSSTQPLTFLFGYKGHIFFDERDFEDLVSSINKATFYIRDIPMQFVEKIIFIARLNNLTHKWKIWIV